MSREPLRIYLKRKKHDRLVRKLRGRDKINVVFVISTVTMWQHQDIYELMRNDPHFNATIIYVPFCVYSKEESEKVLLQVKDYFSRHRTPFLVYDELDFSEKSFREQFLPDIIFYPQWYAGNYDANIDIVSFYDRLICIVPYGICITNKLFCDTRENNYAWKQYQTSQTHLKICRRESRSKGRNVVIVGYPKGDTYREAAVNDPWKNQEKTKKRIIWAPHFTIEEGITVMHRSNFLNMAEFMWELTKKYEDSIQFAFKPHPRLLTELYKHRDWGRERTDAYYKMWEEGKNTQLETGEYTDLFKTSDGMIHDCGSFSAEYLYVGKPAFFVTEDAEKLKLQDDLSEFGCAAMDAHYVGYGETAICSFLENVILGHSDPKRAEREKFVKEQLYVPECKTTSQLIYEDICRELWIPTASHPLSPKEKRLKKIYRLLYKP